MIQKVISAILHSIGLALLVGVLIIVMVLLLTLVIKLYFKAEIDETETIEKLIGGKDGKEKLNTNSGDLKAIFSVVDSMPMRKKEMHSSKCLSKNNKEH